jgi:pimeloyl-ACP methyl ester carboxylesterase
MENETLTKTFKTGKIRRSLVLTIVLAFSALSTLTSNVQAQVKNIVLVHGAFADGSGWEGVYKILKSHGFNVSVVGNPDTGVPDDIASTKRVLAMQDGPVILVGHSYGGTIITEAGNDAKVVGLVYIAAFAQDQGESIIKLAQAGPADTSHNTLPPKDGFVWYDVAKFHSNFCADLPNDLADFMAHSQLPLAASAFAYEMGAPAWKTKPSWYVVATQDRTIPPDAERFMGKRAGSKLTEIKGSHVVFISHPKEIADIIETAAKNAPAK